MNTKKLAHRAQSALRRTIMEGAGRHSGREDLARVIPVSPEQISDRSEAGTRRILERLRKALREERKRGQSGHWAYDLNRHAALLQAHRAETARLKEIALYAKRAQ